MDSSMWQTIGTINFRHSLHKWLPPILSANIVMWAMRLNIVDWGYFKIQILQEILKTQNQHQTAFCAFLEVEHLYRSVGCARSKRQYLTAPQNQRSSRWMLVCEWMVYRRSTYGIFGHWSAENDSRNTKTNPSELTGNRCSTPKHTQD